MKLFFHLLHMDFRRAFKTYRFPVSILLSLAFIFIFHPFDPHDSVMGYYLVAFQLNFNLFLIYIAAALPYATAFSEDKENKFMSLTILRSKSGVYVLAKSITIMITSFFSVFISVSLYMAILKIKYPFVSSEFNFITNNADNALFGDLLPKGHYVLFLIASIAVLGCLASVLSLFTAWFSLYFSNKLFVYTLPFLIIYFQHEIVNGLIQNQELSFKCSLIHIYINCTNILNNQLYSFLNMLGITCVLILLVLMMINAKVKDIMLNE